MSIGPHDDVIKWRYWPFVREIHRSPVNFPHKGQWRGALMFTLICARKNGWVNNGGAGDLRRYLAYYDVIVMLGRNFRDVQIKTQVSIRHRSDAKCLLMSIQGSLLSGNTQIFNQENAFENVVCKIVAILFRSKCVNEPGGYSQNQNRDLVICMLIKYPVLASLTHASFVAHFAITVHARDPWYAITVCRR